MNYGETIRLLRINAKMSQSDLARSVGAGITNQSVSGWERGKAKPSTQNLFELARIFNVGVGQIMNDHEQTTPPQAEPSRAPEEPSSLLFVALEETLLLVGVNAAAAAEIAEVVELAVANLRTPQGMAPEDAIRRIIRWEIPDILARKR